MELKIGGYVRTKYGKIGRIISFESSVCFDLEKGKGNIEDVAYMEKMVVVDTHYNFEDEPDTYFSEDIIKSSPNIIDLIEEGDYVNGRRVNRVEKEDGTFLTIGTITLFVPKNETDLYLTKDYNDKNKLCKIGTIVTKEQFESMQYVVKEY